MTISKSIFVFLITITVISCSNKFEVDISQDSNGVKVSFYSVGIISRRAVSQCVWSINVIDEKSSSVVFSAVSEKNCIDMRMSYIDYGIVGMKIKLNNGFKEGNSYHIEVNSESGFGKSKTWIQKL